MKKIKVLIISLIASLGLVSCGLMGFSTMDVTVFGQVTDNEGNPIDSIVVSLNIAIDGYTISAITAEDGTFTISEYGVPYVDILYVTARDFDGERNGGYFKEQTITGKLTLFEEGEDNHKGHFVCRDALITLTKQ